MTEHRWSGWPGAWCLDCGCDDPMEIALADGDVIFDEDASGNIIRWFKPGVEDRIAKLMECPEPGSNRHNSYEKEIKS